MRRHLFGVLVALFLGVIALLGINFFVAQELLVEDEVIINQSKSEVYDFVKDPMNLSLWMNDLSKFNLEKIPDQDNYQFIGLDNMLHQLNFIAVPTAHQLKVKYLVDQRHKANFRIEVIGDKSQSIVKFKQIWNLGWNPLAKLLASGTKDQQQKALKRDLIALKRFLENKE